MDAVVEQTLKKDSSAILIFSLWLFGTMLLWFFAFYSVSSDTPDWVRRAQIVCFGSNELGLPSISGWILLVLSPAAMFAAMYVAVGEEIKASYASLRSSKANNFLRAIVLLVFIECFWVASTIYEKVSFSQGADFRNDPEVLPDHYPVIGKAAADFNLVDQYGNQISLSSFLGKPVLLSFVFAHCQSVCPTLVRTVNLAAQMEGSDKIKTILITLDPWRDTPASLASLAKKWQLVEGVSILSSSPEQVEAVLDAYNVPRQRDMNSGDVAHPAIVHIVSPEGKIHYTFNDPSVSWIRQAIKRVSQ